MHHHVTMLFCWSWHFDKPCSSLHQTGTGATSASNLHMYTSTNTMLKWTPSMDPPLLAEIEMSPDLQRDNIQEALRALKESDCSQVAKHLLTSFIQHMKFGAGQSRVVLQVISRANSCDELEEFGRWLRAFLNHRWSSRRSVKPVTRIKLTLISSA